MGWIHGSPNLIATGDWIVPAANRGGLSRTHPLGYAEQELTWYEPHRVYVLKAACDDMTKLNRNLPFLAYDQYVYAVEPVDIGRDLDLAAERMNSATCAQARVVRCLYAPPHETC